jgi:chromosome segregation ATPase
MAREGITKEQVVAACETLQAQGKKPTIRSVREQLGDTGSPNTIHRYLTAWQNDQPITAAVAPALSAGVVNAIAAEMARAVDEVRGTLQAQLLDQQTAAGELAKAGEVLEAERDELQEQVAMLATERDTHAGRVAQLESDVIEAGRVVDQVRAELGQRIEQEQQATEAARVELAKAQLRAEANATAVAEQRAEIERLRAELARETAARVQAEQAAAVAGAKLEAMERRAGQAEARAELVERQALQAAEAARAELAKVQATAARDVAAAQEETKAARAEARKDRDDARAELARVQEAAARDVAAAQDEAKAARVEAAEIRGRLAAADARIAQLVDAGAGPAAPPAPRQQGGKAAKKPGTGAAG